MDAFIIEKLNFHLKHEPWGNFLVISGWTSGTFSCLGQEKNGAEFIQVRDIFWETLHKSFYCH